MLLLFFAAPVLPGAAPRAPGVPAEARAAGTPADARAAGTPANPR